MEINKEYTLLTINFDKPDGTPLTVQEAFPYVEGMTAAKAAGSADNIQVMTEADDMSYTTYFVWNGKSGGGQGTVKDPADVNTWALAGKTAQTTDTLPKGSSMWYQSHSAKADDSSTWYNLTVAGGVSKDEKYEFTINKEYTLVGSPFPVEIPLNGGVVVSDPTLAKAAGTADNLQIMNATSDMSYTTYFTWNGKSGGGQGTVKDPEDVGKWALAGKTAATTDTFPVGRAAWFQSRSATGTLKFINPVAQ